MEEQENISQEQQPAKKSSAALIITGIVVALIALVVAVLGYHFLYAKPLIQENEELKEGTIDNFNAFSTI